MAQHDDFLERAKRLETKAQASVELLATGTFDEIDELLKQVEDGVIALELDLEAVDFPVEDYPEIGIALNKAIDLVGEVEVWAGNAVLVEASEAAAGAG